MSGAPPTVRRPGQAMVEFALTLPLFLVLMLALIDFGLGIYAYNQVAFAAQEGMRRGIVIGKDCGAYQKDGNKQMPYTAPADWSDGVAANSAGYQTYTTSTVTTVSPTNPVLCTGNPTPRKTIVGTVNDNGGLLDRSQLKVLITSAPGGTAGTPLPPANSDITVCVYYRYTPIWGYLIDGLTRLVSISLAQDFSACSTGKTQ